MSTDIIPWEDRGEFRITKVMMTETLGMTLAALEVLLREEATRRGLNFIVETDIVDSGITVRWKTA
jgi:hypothetical protein